ARQDYPRRTTAAVPWVCAASAFLLLYYALPWVLSYLHRTPIGPRPMFCDYLAHEFGGGRWMPRVYDDRMGTRLYVDHERNLLVLVLPPANQLRRRTDIVAKPDYAEIDSDWGRLTIRPGKNTLRILAGPQKELELLIRPGASQLGESLAARCWLSSESAPL